MVMNYHYRLIKKKKLSRMTIKLLLNIFLTPIDFGQFIIHLPLPVPTSLNINYLKYDNRTVKSKVY